MVTLVDIRQLHRFAHLERTSIGLLQSHNHAEEGGLSCSVRTNDAHNAVGRKREFEVLDEHLIAIGLRYAVSLDDLVAQARTVGNEDFQLLLTFLLLFVQHLVVGVQASFSLCLTGFRRHTHPFQLSFQCLPALRSHFLLHLHAFCLLLEPARIVAFPRDAFASVEFQNPSCHIVEEVAVMRDADHSSFILLQVLLQPVDGLCIEVVRRLVEQ